MEGKMDPLKQFFIKIFPEKNEKRIISLFIEDLSEEERLEKLIKEYEKESIKQND